MPERNLSGDRYCPFKRTPKCKHVWGQCPGTSVPVRSPRRTTSPGDSDETTGSKLDSKPTRMSDRQHRPIHDHPDEIHRAVGRRIHRGSRRRTRCRCRGDQARRASPGRRTASGHARADRPASAAALAYGGGCRSRGGRCGRPRQWPPSASVATRPTSRIGRVRRERHAPIVQRGIRVVGALTAECGVFVPDAAGGGEVAVRSRA